MQNQNRISKLSKMSINPNNRKLLRQLWKIIILFSLFVGCLIEPDDYGALVPPTVDQNADLPSLKINVAGHSRLVHFKTFGNPDNPPFFILPGSLSDMRPYLPLHEFQDLYFVVMWDLRGNGLSERVTKSELTYDAMVEEIQAMKNQFSPDQPITILGHSWSAVFVAMYLDKYPLNVEQAVLMEPFGLSSEIMDKTDIDLNLTTTGYLDMMYSSKYMTPKDHETLDYQMLATLKSGVRDYFCDADHLPPWQVWRVGGYALIVWEKNLLKNHKYNYDFTKNLSSFQNEILLVGSQCSPIGYDFQEKYHKPLFQKASILKIENSGHRMITEQYDALVDGLRDFLKQ